MTCAVESALEYHKPLQEVKTIPSLVLPSSGSSEQVLSNAEDAQAILTLNEKISNLESEIISLKSQLIKSKNSSIETKIALFSPRSKARVTRLTAMARGFMARSSIRKVKIHHAARSSGVLVALKNTVQGTLNT